MSGYNGQKESLHSLMKRSFCSTNTTRSEFFFMKINIYCHEKNIYLREKKSFLS